MGAALPLLLQSFGFKYGLPTEADFVFDVRCLQNPHWVPHLQPLSGLEPEISAFLEGQGKALALLNDIQSFLIRWLPYYVQDHRKRLTVAIGCTGGKHRSVFVVEKLKASLKQLPGYLLEVNHRDL